MNSSSEAKSTLLEKVKDFFSTDNLTQRFHLTKGRMLEMVVYLLVGFVVGYLLKKYSKFVFTLVMICLVLLVLHQLDLISVYANWSKIQQVLGIPPQAGSPVSSIDSLWLWMKGNVGLVLSFFFGFLIGLRLG